MGRDWHVHEEFGLPGAGPRGGDTFDGADLVLVNWKKRKAKFYVWEVKSSKPGAQSDGSRQVQRYLMALRRLRYSAERGFALYRQGPEPFNGFMISDGSFRGVIAYWDPAKRERPPKAVPHPKEAPQGIEDLPPSTWVPPVIVPVPARSGGYVGIGNGRLRSV